MEWKGTGQEMDEAVRLTSDGLDKSWRKPTLAPVGTTIGPGGLTAVFGKGTGVSLQV
jgi:hypothetical protein